MNQGLKVLIVEDDNYLSEIYKKQFEKDGFIVAQAYDGFDGLTKIPIEKPSIVLLDLILPELTGLEFLNIIKKNTRYKNIPIVVLSNLRDEEKIKNALLIGAEGYIIKTTLTPRELVEEVKRYLSVNN